jgi:3-deoxy-D-manno-octulosonic-acid transferase
MTSLPLSLRAYRMATAILEPAAPVLLHRRAHKGKESLARMAERLGHPSKPRPAGQLIWIHGASVGECMSVLPLIDALLATQRRSVLVTSGTVTSAKLMAERLPAHAIHQFAPVDTPRVVDRFLAHWRPDAALFVDSEIWPNILIAAHAAGIPLAIVNGRMTEKSFAGWTRAKGAAASLFSLYGVILVQDQIIADRFKALGARNVEVSGSLKADAPALPADNDALEELRQQIGARPIFLATNTHDGEEHALLPVHDALRSVFPELLTILAPRHAGRGAEIAEACGSHRVARRSLGQPITADTEIYIADTMGELGLFYRLATFAFIGKSLVGEGGQNPLEAARLGVAVLAGPHTENFQEAYDTIFAAQGLGRAQSAEDVGAAAAKFLYASMEARAVGMAARDSILPLGGALDRTHRAIERLMSSHART